MNEIEKYVKERDAALISTIKYSNLDIFESFVMRNKNLYSYYFIEKWKMASLNTKWCTVMKMACNCNKVPEEVKKQAMEYLDANGCDYDL